MTTPRCRQFTRCTVEAIKEESDEQKLRKVSRRDRTGARILFLRDTSRSHLTTHYVQILSVSSDAFDDTRIVVLEDDWFDMLVRVGENRPTSADEQGRDD